MSRTRATVALIVATAVIAVVTTWTLLRLAESAFATTDAYYDVTK